MSLATPTVMTTPTLMINTQFHIMLKMSYDVMYDLIYILKQSIINLYKYRVSLIFQLYKFILNKSLI